MIPHRHDAYGTIAPWYDVCTAPLLRRARQRVTSICLERGWGRVLDIGCGTGVQLALLRAAGIEAVGLDASPAMLRRAARRLGGSRGLVLGGRAGENGSREPSRESWRERAREPSQEPAGQGAAGGFCLPFARGAFDAALLALVLHESGEGEALFREALRLAPKVLIVEWRMPERNLDLPLQPLVFLLERLAGREHWRRFRAFAATGWLRGMADRCGAVFLSEEPLAARALALAEYAACVPAQETEGPLISSG